MSSLARASVYLCCVAATTFIGGFAVAERLRLGPTSIVANVNGVQLPTVLTGAVAVDSLNGDVNVDGELILTSQIEVIEQGMVTILNKLLPYKIDASPCTVEINELKNFKIVYARSSYEIRLLGTLPSTLRCRFFSDKGDIGFDFPFKPNASDKTKLGWKILRKPTVDIPWTWWAAMEATRGDPRTLVLEKTQLFLDEHATMQLPLKLGGIRAAFKGANFDGEKDNFQFRIKGDMHASAADIMSFLQAYLVGTPLEFTFKLP